MEQRMYVVVGVVGILLSLACGGGESGGPGGGGARKRQPSAPTCIEGRTKCLHGDVMKCQGGDWRLDYDCSPDEPCDQTSPEDEAVCLG